MLRPESVLSLRLLYHIADLWFTDHGFSLSSQLFEQYKKATKSSVKGKKGLRKSYKNII